MGLAASQARFLCITARKADCEYKSTELAQQKLELTNQMTTISNEYANAMNSTRLVWCNDAVDSDYGLSYALLMTPSAMNDYNPYMVTTSSGAIVLNSEYANAARAAGISKAGGIGSQESRDKFIQALVPAGIITQETADSITVNDYRVSIDSSNNITIDGGTLTTGGINWNSIAGMGSEPLNKSVVDAMNIYDLALSETIGQQPIDWAQMFVSSGEYTETTYKNALNSYSDMISDASIGKITNSIINQLENDKQAYKDDNQGKEDTDAYKDEVARYDNLISYAKRIMAGKYDDSGYLLEDDGTPSSVTYSQALSDITAQLKQDKADFEANNSKNTIDIESNKFNVSGKADLTKGTYTVVQNGIINAYKSDIEGMTIGDILTSDIVLMSSGNADDFMDQVKQLFNYIAGLLGYNQLQGTGLNVDDASASALEMAYKMTMAQFFRTYICNTGSHTSSSSMTENSAYQNAVEYNGFVTDGENEGKGKYCAVSLSNMLAAFLTYYDNALNGVNSPYVIGDTTDTSIYVTDNSSYYYLMQDDTDAVTEMDEINADFFDMLYNNICEHGWREDAQLDDTEYLESAIKNGRYSLSSLNMDGYYYQTRYNETGYIIEETDSDAIARAEAEFTSKKAELTYKEDTIDLKTKQLDAEISSLTTEYDTVKTLISNSISKTFSLFQN